MLSWSSSSQQEAIFELVGLGFGPANIAIAGALTESWQGRATPPSCSLQKVLFIEKHKTFRWHPGMLLPDAKMQISFMKDLATLRNPQSPYTFLSYLHSQGRLASFINRGSTVPTRKEYSDYLGWVAQCVQERGVEVLYGHEIVEIDSAADDTIAVRYRDLSSGEESIVKTRNIVISPGGSPRVPAFITPVIKHPYVLHSSAYATSIGPILESLSKTLRPLRVVVIGSGQSAAEVTLDLRSRLSSIPSETRHIIQMLIRKGSLKPSDDSPFANEIFDPASTDVWFSLSSKHIRDMMLAEYKLTNYGVVNPRTLEAFYEVIYDQKLDDGITHRVGTLATTFQPPLVDIKPYTFIASIEADEVGNMVQPELLLSPEVAVIEGPQAAFKIKRQNIVTHVETKERCDLIVYATGYERSSWVELLKNSSIGKHFGLGSWSSNVRLVPSSDHMPRTTPIPTILNRDNVGSGALSATNSVESTPLTSPELSMSSSGVLDRAQHQYQEVAISRNYRLLPLGFNSEKSEETFTPRIYLQGVEEYTHGLSDTLLSVMGVRAGELVCDLNRT